MYHSMILEDCLDMLSMLGGLEAKDRRSEARGQKSATAGDGEAEVGGKKRKDRWMTASIGRGTRVENSIDHLSNLLRVKVDKMASFLWGMTHPDGRIALFNDSAFGIEAEPDELMGYYKRVTGNAVGRDVPRTQHFPETGYFIMSPRQGDRLIVDCGPVGPDYQPGHSHCDTLSLELSLKGHRVVVDSGCCQYEDADIRQYNRGNAGHNTVTVDGQNQSEIWGAHRCARRARPVKPELIETSDGALVFEGEHDGYSRLPGRPIHHRRISWRDDGLRVEDRIDGNGRHAIESCLHIHPEMHVEMEKESVLISAGNKPVASASASGLARIKIKDGWYCPEFGIKEPCKVLCLKYEDVQLPFNIGWRFLLHS
jgi:uncharacterized heparinase superfamily protein